MVKRDRDDDIGARLRAVREAHGLSQRELMRRTGVSNATISLIETGGPSPTVGMLKKILSGLPMTLAEFFTYDGTSANDKVFYSDRDLVEISKGGVSYRQIGGNLAGKAIQLLRERYEPGADTGKLPLRHDGEECGVILKGRLKVTVGGRTRTLKAGDAYYFKSDQPHTFKNESTEPCELVTACTPPSF
ncbi:MAG: cupin domain-containing protein [Sphingomonadales bacterium]|nr:cupin domain-containing protein [Sphingomonadales bacterium]